MVIRSSLLYTLVITAKSPQTNGICERFHRTIQDEFYAIAFRKKVYRSIEELQTDLNNRLRYYNDQRTHTGKHCYGKTPMQTFLDAKPMAREKLPEQLADDRIMFTFDNNYIQNTQKDNN